MSAAMNLNPLPGAKQAYVGTMRLARPVAQWLGLLSRLNSVAADKRWAHFLRSLFAIHDIDGLIELDVPWWTYSAIDEIEAFLHTHPQARVFEYGSGASTVWLSKRAGEVKSVEHDKSWHALVSERLSRANPGKNSNYTLIEADTAVPGTDPVYLSEKSGYAGLSFETYARAILHEDGLFDVIVIDGRARGACLRHAVQKLSADGIIVFDNSKRQRYQEAMGTCGLQAQIFRGLTPSLPYSEETTILKRLPGHLKE